MRKLRARNLVPVGGSWSGLLFENPLVGYPLQLTWSFRIAFAPVEVRGEELDPALDVDWVPVGSSTWTAMAGHRFAGSTFGEPIEGSFSAFDDHRYDRAEIVVEERDGTQLAVRASIEGDVDGLGIRRIEARAALDFEGILVQTDATGTDVAAATELLRGFTSIDGLHGRARGHNVGFRPEEDGG